MARIQPNTAPQRGTLAVMWYGDLKHVAVVESVSKEGITISECNMPKIHGTMCGERTISFLNAHVDGFWSPTASLSTTDQVRLVREFD